MTLRHPLLVLVTAMTLIGCSKPAENAAGASASAKASASASAAVAASAMAPLMVTAEDVIALSATTLSLGPIITGTIQPERRADLRAELSAVVLQVLKENGDVVKRGDLLVRLDDTSIRDAVNSAEEAARASAQSFEQTERQLQRQKTLRASGMTAAAVLEDAETRRNNAQSDLVAARSRAVTARQQLQRTLVRAPFDGIVSDRKVSAGDTAAVGKELLKVIDPTSMRFEGLVSADKIGDVQSGQKVSFRVNGQEQQEYFGTVKRVDPAANPTTRQVAVLVGFAAGPQPRTAGLYAEGRIESGAKPVLMIPQSALVTLGEQAFAWRLAGGVMNKVALKLGARDARRGEFEVLGGLAVGDKVMRNPVGSLKDGQKAELVASAGAKTAGK